MNTFVTAATNEATTTRTENGDVAYTTSLDRVVDLFFAIGAMRARKESEIERVFSAAYQENPDLAVRVALYGRDIRQGAGERKVFRTILNWLVLNQPDHALRVLPLVPALGRWDDVFVYLNSPRNDIATAALGLYASALANGNALAAKWAPREKSDRLTAARIAGFMQLNSAEYRKMIASLSKTVEQQMCANQWDKIVYDHVPSVASSRYSNAFKKHDNDRYARYLDAVKTGKVSEATGKVAKINTGAVYPYDVVKSNVDSKTADVMWSNLPDFVPQGMSFLPIVDVSGSMGSPVGGTTTCLDVALSLGMYLSERNKSAFKDLFITFSSNPKFQKIVGSTIRDRYRGMITNDWGMSTDLDKAMRLVVATAVDNNVPAADMPQFLLVLSDMEFNGGGWGGGSKPVSERTKDMFRQAGYSVPNIVWWNIQSRNGTTPIRADESGMALVSGFSPSIMTSLLAGEVTPRAVMLKAISGDRYAH